MSNKGYVRQIVDGTNEHDYEDYDYENFYGAGWNKELEDMLENLDKKQTAVDAKKAKKKRFR